MCKSFEWPAAESVEARQDLTFKSVFGDPFFYNNGARFDRFLHSAIMVNIADS